MTSPELYWSQFLSEREINLEFEKFRGHTQAEESNTQVFEINRYNQYGCEPMNNTLNIVQQSEFITTNIGLMLNITNLKIKFNYWLNKFAISKKETRADIDSLITELYIHSSKCLKSMSRLSKQVDDEREKFPFHGGLTTIKIRNEWCALEARITTIMQVIVELLDRNNDQAKLLFAELQ